MALRQKLWTAGGIALPKAPGGSQPLRWPYAIAVALPLIVLNTGWIANSEMKTGVTELTISTLFLGITFILFVLTLLNLALRSAFGARAAMSQPELMALYTMLSMSSVVAGVGHFGFLLPFLASPFHFNTPTNGWETFWHLLPSFIGPRDPDILKPFFLGHSTAFQAPVLLAWAYPLAVWSLFLLLLLWTTLCLAAILRRRWDDEEHLPFPVIALPLEMTRDGAPLYRQPMLWAGFTFPFLLHSLNSLHSIIPTLPTFPINSAHDVLYDDGLSFPWNGAGSFFNMQHPAGVGFGYLINTDVSFSLWFFYLLKKAVDVWAAAGSLRDPATGWYVDSNGQFPYFSYQGWGAWLALGLATLWTGRRYFREYLGGPSEATRRVWTERSR